MRSTLVATTLAALLAGCVIGDATEESAPPLEPTFLPASPASPGAPTDAAASPEAEAPAVGASPAPSDTSVPTAPPAPSETSSASSSTTPPPPAGPSAPPLTAAITDPSGDATPSLEREPEWADLVGAELQRRGDGFTLWVDLAGGAPTGSGSADHTMNVASFYDLDGDGGIDVEVWVNLADGGWDSAHYDNRDGTAAFSDDDPVEVAVEGERLRIDFPLGVLDGSSAFRWAVASEWGRYEQLGTALTVRDDAPDDDRPAAFPG